MALSTGLPFWRGETIIEDGPVRFVSVCGLGWVTPVFCAFVPPDCRSRFWFVRGPFEDVAAFGLEVKRPDTVLGAEPFEAVVFSIVCYRSFMAVEGCDICYAFFKCFDQT